MLVRAQSVILWNSFLSQPTTTPEEEGSSRSILSNEQDQQADVQMPTDLDATITAQSAKNHSTNTADLSTSTTLDASVFNHHHHLEPEEEEVIVGNNVLSKDNKDVVSDSMMDSSSFAYRDMHSTKNTTTSSIISSTATSFSLLDKPIPTYFHLAEATEEETMKSGDGLIYYKRREDYFPQQQHQEDENDSIHPSTITNSQQSRRQASIRSVLVNKTATKSPTVNEGMPVFQQQVSPVDKLKPKAIFKRLKTMVNKKKNNSKRRSTSTF